MAKFWNQILPVARDQEYKQLANEEGDETKGDLYYDHTGSEDGAERIRMVDASNALAAISLSNHTDSTAYSKYQTTTKIRTFINFSKSATFHLSPSWISKYWDTSKPKIIKTFPTDYLNGVRGIAACAVVFQHYLTLYYHHWPFDGYGSKSSKASNNNHIAQMPFIRLFYSGKFGVAIFYILSGYVLAYKPIQYVRQRNMEALANNLASAIFRRFLRLFLPILPPIILVAFLIAGGWMPDGEDPFAKRAAGTGHWWRDFWAYLGVYDHSITPWSLEMYQPQYLEALYTLRYEFRGSIMVFSLVLGTAKIKSWVRLVVLWGVSLYALRHGRWDSFLFTHGIVLAELRYIRAARAISNAGSHRKGYGVLKRVVCICLLITSLFLGSWPRRKSHQVHGLRTLSKLTPAPYHRNDEAKLDFWTAIAALMLLYSLENLPILQKPFETKLVRYLGDISFSVYVLHFPLLYATSRYVAVPLMGRFGLTAGWVINGVVLLPVLAWVSDVQWRLVDMKSVQLARWLEGWVSAD